MGHEGNWSMGYIGGSKEAQVLQLGLRFEILRGCITVEAVISARLLFCHSPTSTTSVCVTRSEDDV